MEFDEPNKPVLDTGHKEKRTGKRGRKKPNKHPASFKVVEKKPPEPKTLRETWEGLVHIKQSSEVVEGKLPNPNNDNESHYHHGEFEIPLNTAIEAEVLLRLNTTKSYEPLQITPQEDLVAEKPDIQPLDDLQHQAEGISLTATNKVNEEALAKWREQRDLKKLKTDQNYQAKKLHMQEQAQVDSQKNLEPTELPSQPYELGKVEALRKEELPDEALAIVEKLNIPPEHRLEQSAWHSIGVDKKTGHAVEVSAIDYGEAFRQEQKQEKTLAEEPSEVSVASGQLAVGNAAPQSLVQNLTSSSDSQAKRPSFNSPIEATLKLSQHVATSGDLWLWAVLGVIIVAIIASASL